MYIRKDQEKIQKGYISVNCQNYTSLYRYLFLNSHYILVIVSEDLESEILNRGEEKEKKKEKKKRKRKNMPNFHSSSRRDNRAIVRWRDLSSGYDKKK